MTPIAGFILAIVAALTVRNGRRAMLVVLVPWLVVLGYQSFYIASGRAISPPSTVMHFPDAIGYWLVQAIILAPALGTAYWLGDSESRRHSGDAEELSRRSWLASAVCLGAAIVIIELGFVMFRNQGGTVYTGHHSADGSPPLIGELGLLLSFVTCALLGTLAFKRRRSVKRNAAVLSA